MTDRSTYETHKWERLAPVNELRTLPGGQAVLIHDNTLPAKVRLRPYYRQPQWRDLGGWLGRDSTHPPRPLNPLTGTKQREQP